MATLVLATAGAAVGGALMPAGIGLFGATLSGAVLGRAVGAMAGRYIDQALFGASGQNKIVENTGSRLSDLQVTASSEGSPIPRIFGRARLGGQIIWATRFEEEVIRDSRTVKPSGKGMGGGPKQTTITTSYNYYANFAIALCEGEISRLGRVWVDGKEINLAEYNYRLYRGDEEQLPDSLLEAKEGAGNAPAYRGLAYIVFERLPLELFGNRIPQFNFEVFKALDDVEKLITAVTIIPATGEFAYEVEPVERHDGQGGTISENTHHQMGGTDWSLSMDQLGDMMPNCGSVSLFVSWIGSDLRAEQCVVQPAIENREKVTTPYSWKVAGQTRDTAYEVSRIDDRSVFGGTPSDVSVIAAIQDLKTRGLEVSFNPFLLLDIQSDNVLPDPYGGANQSAFPWRGRITCHPAPGQVGSPDKSAAAATQLNSFIGTCSVGDFDISSGEVVYSGPSEWGWRRMILHYAHLCKLAGGVDAFLLGSELKGLTAVRDGASSYPFVSALVALAADVKAVLGGETKVSYAADWSEYFGHQPSDGSNDVFFHLDALWSSDDIDMIAMDCYWPLADWRDEDTHLDAGTGWQTTYDPAYLKSNMAGGEGYDWYYASSTDRDAQIRSPITDGAGKPWMFRYKDIANWWSQPHYNRPGGVESGAPTDWVPQSKPFWLMEVGCPAIDKGANEPNIFYDGKSSESRFPHYSRGTRDDTIQRRYLQSFYEYFDSAHDDFLESANPSSSVYAGRMVELSKIHAYTWDARPYPAFPYDEAAWSDGDNWFLGHWLNGRMAGGPLQAVIEGILQNYGFDRYNLSSLNGMMEGYILDGVMSARDALQPLEMAFFLDSYESEGVIRFSHKGQSGVSLLLARNELVDAGEDTDLYTLSRAQETDLPLSAKLTYIDGVIDYRQAVVEARRDSVATTRVATAQLPIVLGQEQAQGIADSWLHDVWSGREKASFSLPPSKLGVEPGDVVRLEIKDREIDLRVSQTATAEARTIESLSLQPHIYRLPVAPSRLAISSGGKVFGPSLAVFLDLPLLRGDETDSDGYVAGYQSPWPGAVSFYRSASDAGYGLAANASLPAIMGETLTSLQSGAGSRWDWGTSLDVTIYSGELLSREKVDVLSGANLAAIEHESGQWEVVQFLKAELISDKTYRLSGLLRGQVGTEPHITNDLAIGARFVVLDDALTPVSLTDDEIGLDYSWKAGPSTYDLGHRSYRTYQKSFVGLGQKPFAPVHLKLVQGAGGDLDLSWVRRTRKGGDNWQSLEVPLSEDVEAYEMDILDGSSAVVRTLTCSTPSLVYSNSLQTADFGGLQTSLSIVLYQMSARFGRGHGATATLSI
jgi:GTA TIM-barrel-like domain/Putative phage tail protein